VVKCDFVLGGPAWIIIQVSLTGRFGCELGETMPLDKEEFLWRMVNEHMTQARHQETLRSSMTTLLITLSSAIIAFVTFDKDLSSIDLPAAFLLLFLGIFGVFFRRHITSVSIST
jgi:hypothetical protein